MSRVLIGGASDATVLDDYALMTTTLEIWVPSTHKMADQKYYNFVAISENFAA